VGLQSALQLFSTFGARRRKIADIGAIRKLKSLIPSLGGEAQASGLLPSFYFIKVKYVKYPKSQRTRGVQVRARGELVALSLKFESKGPESHLISIAVIEPASMCIYLPVAVPYIFTTFAGKMPVTHRFQVRRRCLERNA